MRGLLAALRPLTFEGVELTPSLSAYVHITYKQRPSAERNALSGRAARRLVRWPRVAVALAQRPVGSDPVHLHRLPYLIGKVGPSRTALISDPVIDALGREDCQVIHTDTVKRPSFRRYPVARGPLRAAMRAEWPAIARKISAAASEFRLGAAGEAGLLRTASVAAMYVHVSRDVLDQVRPQAVVLEHDRRLAEGVLCQVARERGIPSVTLVHGVSRPLEFDVQWTPIVADYMVAWGTWMAEQYEAAGVPRERIHIGGYPRLYPLPSVSGGGEREALFLSSSFGEVKPELETFLQATEGLSGWRGVIRPHPDEDLDWYHERGLMDRVQRHGEVTMTEALSRASVIVGSGSTSCFDAIILGIPAVFVGQEPPPIPLMHRAIAHGVASYAEDAAALRRAIVDAEAHEGRGSVLTELSAALGVAAAERTAQIIRDIASGEAAGKPSR